MTKQETKRAILRAFGDAARVIQHAQQQHGRVYAFTVAQSLKAEPWVLGALGYSRRKLIRCKWLDAGARAAFGA